MNSYDEDGDLIVNSKYECLQGISFSLTLDSLAVALLMLGVHIGVPVLIVAVHVITISVRGLIWVMRSVDHKLHKAGLFTCLTWGSCSSW